MTIWGKISIMCVYYTDLKHAKLLTVIVLGKLV